VLRPVADWLDRNLPKAARIVPAVGAG